MMAALSSLRDEEKLPPVLQDIVMGFFTKEEVFIYNTAYLNPKLTKLSVGVKVQQALNFAAKNGWLEGLKVFSESKEVTHEGWNEVAQIAAKEGHIAVMEWLETKSADLRLLWYIAFCKVAEKGDIPAMERIASKEVHLYWCWAFHNAVKGGHIPAMEWLEAKGAQIGDHDLQCADEYNQIKAGMWILDKLTRKIPPVTTNYVFEGDEDDEYNYKHIRIDGCIDKFWDSDDDYDYQ